MHMFKARSKHRNSSQTPLIGARSRTDSSLSRLTQGDQARPKQFKDLNVSSQNICQNYFITAYPPAIKDPTREYSADDILFNPNMDIDRRFREVLSDDHHAEYAITYAVLTDNRPLLLDLCEKRARLDVKDRLNADKNPLELAIIYGRATIAKILIGYGATFDKNIEIPSSSNLFKIFGPVINLVCTRERNYEAIHSLLNLITETHSDETYESESLLSRSLT